MLYLSNELFKQRNQKITFHVGSSINGKEFHSELTDYKAAQEYKKKVTVIGNERTNDHVIYRELRVKPGDLFNRSQIIRSIREIGQLGFFDTNVTPEVKPDWQNKTADIDFTVTEKGGSQIELQGGYGGGAFIGTLGLSFNNFAIRNMFKKDAYKPLPTGDGQKLSLRLQDLFGNRIGIDLNYK